MSNATTTAMSCPSGQSLLELRFDASGWALPMDALVGNATREPLFAVTVPSNGTVIRSFERRGQDVDEDGSVDASLCLPADGCYGLVDYTGVWAEGGWLDSSYRLRWNGSDLASSGQSSFPYFLRFPVDDDSVPVTSSSSGFDSQMLFAEFGNGCSLACNSDESLYEVQIWAGNTGASHSWRVENADMQELLGCNDDDDGKAGCGEAFDVRVTRACLPADATACRRFVFGHPNLVAPEGSFVSDRNGGYSMSTSGAYNPRFVVAVDGNIVADSFVIDAGMYAVANFEAIEIGTGCPSCPDDNPALLETFTYRTLQSPTLAISLADALDPASTPQHMSISPNSLQYARQCLPQSGCYNLQVSIPESAGQSNRSHYERIPTAVKLDSVYFGNQDGVLDASNAEYSTSFVVGAGCTKETACARDDSLVSVKIDTSAQLYYLPFFFAQWFLYNTSNPSEFIQSYDFTASFDRGYPAGSEFQHYLCVPESAQLSFGMFDSVPLAVTWSVERDGQTLTCRQTSEGNYRPYLDEAITTNLDGSCGSALSAGAIAGITIGAVATVALVAFLAWRCYRKGRAMASADAQGGDGDVTRSARQGHEEDGGEAASATSSETDDKPPNSRASTEVDL